MRNSVEQADVSDPEGNSMTTSILLTMVLAVMWAAPVWAGLDEGMSALMRGDYETALKEIKPVAEQGNGFAQRQIGQMYKEGLGVPQDYQESVRWYRLAEKNGTEANFPLGEMYFYGQGVSLDYAEAMKRFRTAAEQGLGPAQLYLGIMYEQGLGAPQDYVMAHMWYNLAAVPVAHSYATKRRDDLATRMTTAQVAEAQRLAREWKPKGK